VTRVAFKTRAKCQKKRTESNPRKGGERAIPQSLKRARAHTAFRGGRVYEEGRFKHGSRTNEKNNGK